MVEKALLVDRYAEEQVQLVKEMKSLVKTLKLHIQRITDKVQILHDPDSEAYEEVDIPGRYSLNRKLSDVERRGYTAILNKQVVVTKVQLETVCNLFRKALNVECDDDSIENLSGSDDNSECDVDTTDLDLEDENGDDK